jgi:Terpene cyclase DEP1
MNKSYSSYFYLLLAMIGGSITFYYVMLGTSEAHGSFNVIEFIQSTWVDSYYAKSLTIDFWTGAIAGTFFVIVEGTRLKMKLFWLFPLIIILIGFAFGFPLFLYFRHKKIIAQNNL